MFAWFATILDLDQSQIPSKFDRILPVTNYFEPDDYLKIITFETRSLRLTRTSSFKPTHVPACLIVLRLVCVAVCLCVCRCYPFLSSLKWNHICFRWRGAVRLLMQPHIWLISDAEMHCSFDLLGACTLRTSVSLGLDLLSIMYNWIIIVATLLKNIRSKCQEKVVQACRLQ